MTTQVDLYLTMTFLQRFVLPFTAWPAFQLGIIDKNGKVLKKRTTLTTQAEKDAWGYYDIMICNLKKIFARRLPQYTPQIQGPAQAMPRNISKQPTQAGVTTIPLSTIAGSFFLFKEHIEDPEDIEEIEKRIGPYIDYVKELMEDAPVNNVGGGQIAGVGIGIAGEPPIRNSKYKSTNLKRRKKLHSYLQKSGKEKDGIH